MKKIIIFALILMSVGLVVAQCKYAVTDCNYLGDATDIENYYISMPQSVCADYYTWEGDACYWNSTSGQCEVSGGSLECTPKNCQDLTYESNGCDEFDGEEYDCLIHKGTNWVPSEAPCIWDDSQDYCFTSYATCDELSDIIIPSSGPEVPEMSTTVIIFVALAAVIGFLVVKKK